MKREIAFRETIRRSAVGERKYIRYFENRGHFAHVQLRLDPAPGQSCFVTRARSFTIPDDCFEAARVAALNKVLHGPIQHFPMYGFEIQFVMGTYLERYSYPEAFATVACMALDEAFLNADPVIMEPWVGVRINVEKDAVASVLTVLTKLLGLARVTVSLASNFMVDVAVPQRLLGTMRNAFALKQIQTFSLPPADRYREISGALSSGEASSFDDWT